MRTSQAERNAGQEGLERLIREAGAKPSGLSYDEQLQQQCDDYNAKAGTLQGLDCEACRNKGNIATVVHGEKRMVACGCMQARRSMQRMKKSGLADRLEACTFASYSEAEAWQKAAKQKAMAYVKQGGGKWFYIGGQVGSGKTHLCTAIVGELLKAGKAARYMLWRDEMTKLRAMRFDKDGLARRMQAWKNVEVLYMDDLLKCGKVEPFELDMTFEIVNGRYNRKGRMTIMSGEKTIDELMEIDEGLGSRIAQQAGEYCVTIGREPGRNWRVRP